jgi:hypothetical protein
VTRASRPSFPRRSGSSSVMGSFRLTTERAWMSGCGRRDALRRVALPCDGEAGGHVPACVFDDRPSERV